MLNECAKFTFFYFCFVFAALRTDNNIQEDEELKPESKLKNIIVRVVIAVSIVKIKDIN